MILHQHVTVYLNTMTTDVSMFTDNYNDIASDDSSNNKNNNNNYSNDDDDDDDDNNM